MKLGSVRFFKVLIVAAAVFIILVPLVLAVVFGTLYARQKKMNEGLEAINWALAHSAPLPDDVVLPDDLPAYIQIPFYDDDGELPPSFEYQTKYPQLYAIRPPVQAAAEKTCYLTFDDGPSPVTSRILDTLAVSDVKATFFVTGRNSIENAEILQRAASEGHTIGVHTWSHNYEQIYTSVDAFLEDFEQMHSYVTELCGVAPTVFRFAGGSINVYNQTLYTEIIAEMTRRGFVFYDWNAAASDAVSGGISAGQVYANVMGSAAGQDTLVVLMHDRMDNESTATALGDIIAGLRDQGYAFAPLTAAVPPVTFFYQE